MSITLDNVKICYIGGGSRNWAWVLIHDLAFEKEIAGTVRLYDLNESAARDNEIIGNQVMVENNDGRWTFTAVASLKEALTGSDFVFISIRPGDFEAMTVDIHEPEQYGIYQSVGDTTGPGGLIRALRTIPQFRDLARSIKAWAPNAWVLNYTNPMSICTQTLYREFPEIKALGYCHEVFHTQRLLRTVLEKARVIKPGTVDREEIKTRVLGINHFTWIDRASWRDIDIIPYYREFAKIYGKSGFVAPGEKNWQTDYFSSAERVKLDLFLRYGLIAAAGDRRLAEFCPHQWYLADPEQVREWRYSLTPVSYRIETRKQLEQNAAAYREGKEKFLPVQSGEEGLRIIKALLGLGNLVTTVNLPNRGQMPDLPQGSVVETNAEFSRDLIQPLLNEGLPNEIRNLTLHHIYNQEGITEAAFEEDGEKAFRVFLNDFSIQTLSRDQARELFAAMTAKTLPQGSPLIPAKP
jgi:alpha-galactosidase